MTARQNTVQHNVFMSNFPYRGRLYSASNRSIDRSISPFTARAAATPIGPNRGLPPRPSLNVNAQPDAVGETVIRIAYLVPPTPSPVISSSRGGSTSRTVHVTRLRSPLGARNTHKGRPGSEF